VGYGPDTGYGPAHPPAGDPYGGRGYRGDPYAAGPYGASAGASPAGPGDQDPNGYGPDDFHGAEEDGALADLSGRAARPAGETGTGRAAGLLPGSDIGADDDADGGGPDGAAVRTGRRGRDTAPVKGRQGRGGTAPPGGPGRKPRRRSGWFAGLLAVLVIIGGLGVVGVYGFRYIEAKYHPPNFTGAGHGQVTFQVGSGETAISIAPRLVKDGVVASTRAFVNAAKSAKNPNALEPGYFKLRKDMSAASAWQLLTSPSSRIQTKVTFPEGLRLSQILQQLGSKTALSSAAYRQAIKDTAALGLPSFAQGKPEGYLFPSTYEFQPNMTATEVLRTMVDQFKSEASALNLPAAAKAGQLSESHVIIVASLIQAEGGRTSDFPKIAEVIYNRLNHNMKLELDSTVEYALGKYGIAATNAELKVNSPYNTYQHTGLPPGPIDSPGADALAAALHPAHGGLLYFVTVDPQQRITKFTSSATQFAKLKAELERNLARGG
jgi:UPF0755 protein